ncbi:uncharacterized protein LOC126846340 [Adelges cooleyi]|uniref:uncharacterized protein LOC126846340 n=1 Tax=Adelges cooleyi TaxID=133065 RepID=UPI00217FC3DF|nr:uncharacterized protein LOC126846340 [Adelges cooleyi]
MMWKIILLLPCFDVLVNAGLLSPYFTGSSSQSSDCQPVEQTDPYPNFVNWVISLHSTGANWTSLDRELDVEKINNAREKLKLSRCPPGDVESLITNSNWDNWPTELRSPQEPFINESYMNGLTLRSIPELSAVVATVSDNLGKGLKWPGILFFFKHTTLI